VPVGSELERQIDEYADVGYWGNAAPPAADGRYDADLVASLYDDEGTVIWPG
jgi:hypothetical protein